LRECGFLLFLVHGKDRLASGSNRFQKLFRTTEASYYDNRGLPHGETCPNAQPREKDDDGQDRPHGRRHFPCSPKALDARNQKTQLRIITPPPADCRSGLQRFPPRCGSGISIALLLTNASVSWTRTSTGKTRKRLS
jgi:hypothetical protein